MKRTGDYTGYSTSGIDEAIENALEKVEAYARFEVVEAIGKQARPDQRHYQVTLKAVSD